jgi:hypothetical protein
MRLLLATIRRHCSHARAAICLLSFLLILPQRLAVATDLQGPVQQALKTINSDEYVVSHIAMTSDISFAKRLILKAPEIQLLTQHCDVAVPQILQILDKSRVSELARIPYFIVFEQCKLPQTLPILANYIESLSVTGDYEVLSKASSYASNVGGQCGGYHYTHVFLYALDAISAFGIQTPSQGSCTIFDKRQEIALAARQEFARRTRTENQAP